MMASAAYAPYLSVEQYLSTTFRPDVDYVDGYVEERNVGEADHGTLQFILANLFWEHRVEWGIRMVLETRLQVASGRYRVPDLGIMDARKPKEQVIREVPLLCIEVLSPEDTLRKMLVRVEDYFAMGVPLVWIFDPVKRSVAVVQPGGEVTERSEGVLRVRGWTIEVELSRIFNVLDEE